MYQKSRCVSREKIWVQSTEKLNDNRDAISLVFLSTVLRENFNSFRITLHNFQPLLCFLTCGIDHSYEARVKCKIGYDGGLITWISAKPTDWTPEVKYSISWKNGRKFSVAENFVFFGVHAVPHLRLLHRHRRTMQIFFCVQQLFEVRTWVNKHKETFYKPSHRTTNKHEETRYRLHCHEERCNRKRIHTHFLKDRNCEMQEGQNYLDPRQETHRWSHASSSKISENWWQQSTKSWLRLVNRETITDTLPWDKIWQLKDPWWNKTSQGRHGIISWNLALICEVDCGIIEKSKSTPQRAKRFWIAEQRYAE